MSDDRERQRRRLARQLMHALTGEGEPVIITETGEVSEHRRDHLERIAPDITFRALVELRQREAEAIRSQRRETYATSEERGDQNQREAEADDRTLDIVAWRVRRQSITGENEDLEFVLYETVMRLPDEVREFVGDQVVFLSGAWGQTFRGMDWSDKWMILLAPSFPEGDGPGIVAHQIAHAWRNHGAERMGYNADEEREACTLAQAWGFTGSGTVFEPPRGDEGSTTYIN